MPGRKRAAPKKGKEEEKHEEQVVASEPPKKQKKVGIDMSIIPKSLLDEGFDQEKNEEKKIPEFLNCPICKEILVEPEMYNCGHTVCKLCITTPLRFSGQRECPVCKIPTYSNTIPNYVVKQMLESQFADETKVRTERLKEIQELAQKVLTYGRSERFTSIDVHFEKFMEEKRFIHADQITKHFMGLRDIKPPVSQEEFQYFLSLKLSNGSAEYKDLGSYIVKGRIGDISYHLDWLAIHKKKRKELLNWMPLIMMNSSRLMSPESTKKYAEIYGLNIGEALPIDTWKTKPAYWLKTVDLGTIRIIGCGDISCRNHEPGGMSYMSDSDDMSDSDSSDDDGWGGGYFY